MPAAAKMSSTRMKNGIQDAMVELTKSRKHVGSSEGQNALRRRKNTLTMSGRRLLKMTSEQVVWQDGCFSVSAEAKWDDTRCGRDVVLSNNNTTVTRSNGNEWGGVLGAQIFTQGTHSFTFYINKCQTDYVYVGIAYDNVDLNDNYNGRNIVLRAGDGSFRVFSSSQGCYGGYRTGDYIRIEVDMNEKTVTFHKNDQKLCSAGGIAGPVRPFLSIGSRDVVITMQSQDPKSLLEDTSTSPRSPMVDIAVRTGLDLVFALLLKEENSMIRTRMLKTALVALQGLPPLSFFRECTGLKEEALTTTADFLRSISSKDSGSPDEERKMAVLVMLELAVARGSLRFILSVVLHLEENCLSVDLDAMPTLRRIGDIQAISDPKIKSLFVDSVGTPETATAVPSQGSAAQSDIISSEPQPISSPPVEDSMATPPPTAEGTKDMAWHDAKSVADAAEAELMSTGGSAQLYFAIILSQLERVSQRLKSSLAIIAPCCLEAVPSTFKQLLSLIARYSPASARTQGHSEPSNWSCYILLALLRLLALNLRQVQQQPNVGSLGMDLVASLRSMLLELVSTTEVSSWDVESLGSVQEEAVAALRAGTPVLFSDPVEIVGLLDVMLRKQSEKQASQTEEHFMVMLLSYLAKPPVVWRVLQLESNKDQAKSKEAELEPKNMACIRLFQCLLVSMSHHFQASLQKAIADGGIKDSGDVIPNACLEVLAVAWRLQHARWSSPSDTGEGESALALCIEMACAVLEHAADVGRAVQNVMQQVAGSSGKIGQAIQNIDIVMKQSALGRLLPEFLAGASAMPANARILSVMTEVLGILDALATNPPGVTLVSAVGMEVRDPNLSRCQVGEAVSRLSAQPVLRTELVESVHECSERKGQIREVIFVEEASYLLVEVDSQSETCGPDEWLQIEDGYGHVVAGRFFGSPGGDWPTMPVLVPGDTVVFLFNSPAQGNPRDAKAWGFRAVVTGHSALAFKVECRDLQSGHPLEACIDSSTPFCLPDNVILSQISFDPRCSLEQGLAKLSVSAGHTTRVFSAQRGRAIQNTSSNGASNDDDSSDTGRISTGIAADEDTGQLRSTMESESFPATPVMTVSPNLRFDFTMSDLPATQDEGMAARNEPLARSLWGWRALICSVIVDKNADCHWLVEILRLLACVSAQLVGSMVAGQLPVEAEATCKQWLASDLFKGGRISLPESPSADSSLLSGPFNLPYKPHPLRHNPMLDELENACIASMLYHLNLHELVKDHCESTWEGEQDEDLLSILRKVANAAGKIRRTMMQQRDQELASQSQDVAVSDSSLSYEELCRPVIDRAQCLLQFVPMYGRQARRSLQSAQQAGDSNEAPLEPSAGLSPTKRWQQAALRVVTGCSPGKERRDSEPKPHRISNDDPDEPSESMSSISDGAESKWNTVVPLLRVHRAYWRVKERKSVQADVVIDSISEFLMSEITPHLIGNVLDRRKKRAIEVESGLRFLKQLLRNIKARTGMAEILHSLLFSEWSQRHYLDDIAASTAIGIGRVRGLFNDVCRSLLDVLEDPFSSCQLRGYAANALAVVYDASDLDYLAMIGLPSVLKDFVRTGGCSLHLAAPALGSPRPNGAAACRLLVPYGGLWYGIYHVGEVERDMSMRLSVQDNMITGTGSNAEGAFTISGSMYDQRAFEIIMHHSGTKQTECKVEVFGRTMRGRWTQGNNSGTLTLHRTRRVPLESTYFSRVNSSFIKFVGRSVTFTGTNQIGVVQAEKPLTRERSYFEVQVLDKGKDCAIAVGVAHREYPLDQMPGWRNGSIAYHMDDGKLFFQRGQGTRFGDKCGQGDVVGCGIELSEEGDRVESVYWTRNGELVGRELTASVLLLPLYATVALHSQGESVFIFEAPPPSSLTLSSSGLVNPEGNLVRLGTERGYTHLYYCGQRTSSGRAGSETVCGPSGGSQCPACEALQESLAHRESTETTEGVGDEDRSTSDFSLSEGDVPNGSAWKDAELQSSQAVDSVWKLLRVLLMQVSVQTPMLHCRHIYNLWDTTLSAIKMLAMQVQQSAPSRALDHGRMSVTGRRCFEELKVSSGSDLSHNLLSDDATGGWMSSGEGREHWIQLALREEVTLTKLSLVLNKNDGSLCPRTIRVLAGESDSALRQVQEFQVNVKDLAEGAHELLILQGTEESYGVIRLCITGEEANVRVRGLVLRGFVLDEVGTQGNVHEKECSVIKRVEVSTNKSAKKFLIDGRSDTCWQSDGRSGQHWIRLHVEADANITSLAIQINAGDGNYCPSLVDVFVGDVPSSLKKLRTCTLSPSGNQKCILLEKCRLSTRIVQVNIRENNGGCDCKVRGIFLTGYPASTKNATADVGRAGQILQDLLSTAHVITHHRKIDIDPSSSEEWIQEMARIVQLPAYDEQTRTVAVSLLNDLCVAWGNNLSGPTKNGITYALLDTLAHTSPTCSIMQPVSTRHLSPHRNLHLHLTKTLVDFLVSSTCADVLDFALKESLAHIDEIYATPRSTMPEKFDYMEVWWSGGQEPSSTRSFDDDFCRPSLTSKPRIILFSACAPEPRRMLLNLSGAKGDISQARCFHIDSFEAPGMCVYLRPLSTPGRYQGVAEKHAMFDLVSKSRKSGCAILVQSLELLLQVMKGEAVNATPGQFSGATLPTDVPWFVRPGRLTPEGNVLISEKWIQLCGSRSLSPVALPSPTFFALPAVLVLENISQRSSLTNISTDLFVGLLRAFSSMSAGRGGNWPLGMRVLYSRVVRAIYMSVRVPACMDILLKEEWESVREVLLLLASQNVKVPLNLTLEDLLSKSSRLCQRLGADIDSSSLGINLPASILGGATSSPSPSSPAVPTKPAREESTVSQEVSVVSVAAGAKDIGGPEPNSEEQDAKADAIVSNFFPSGLPEENLLLQQKTSKKSKASSSTLQQWQKKFGRMRVSQLIAEAAATEDALAIYYSRLSLLSMLDSAATPSTADKDGSTSPAASTQQAAGAKPVSRVLSLDVVTFATILRRLFRTIKPDLSSEMWRRRLKGILESQMLDSALDARLRVQGIRRLAGHCCLLLESMAGWGLVGPSQSSPGKISRICLETKHTYSPNTRLAVMLSAPGATFLRISFDPRCSTKLERDKVTLFTDAALKVRAGCFHGPPGPDNWTPSAVIRSNTLVVHFESDATLGDWGYRLYVQPLDEEDRPISVPLVNFESVRAFPFSTRGKQDITMQGEHPDTGDSGLVLNFSRDALPTSHTGRVGSGRLKILYAGGKHTLQQGSASSPLNLQRTLQFTIDSKESSSSAGTAKIDYKFSVAVSVGGNPVEDCERDIGIPGEEGESPWVAGEADCSFVCWLVVALCAPKHGLLARGGENETLVQGTTLEVVEACLHAVMKIPVTQRTPLLRSLASSVRSLNIGFEKKLTAGARASVRILQEAAITQYGIELPLVGSQRAQFSQGLQALVEVVAALDSGTAPDVEAMTRQELVRAIEAVDGPPGTALCKAVLDGNEEQVKWCICRGAKPWEPCPERLIETTTLLSPHYPMHYAAYAGRDELVKLLFERQADLHCLDGSGNQPLAWAAMRGHKTTVEILLQLGADVNHENEKGKLAADLALPASGVAGEAPAAGSGGDAKSLSVLLHKQAAEEVPLLLSGLSLGVSGAMGMPDPNGPALLVNIHPHPIQRSNRTHEWRCDGCTAAGTGNRYRSVGPGCDFDLCQNCWYAACRFTWQDARQSLKPEAGEADKNSNCLQAVASSGYNPLPEAWRHDSWIPATARRRNDTPCAFPYLHLDANSMLRSAAPCKVSTIVMVLRVGSAALGGPTQCIVDVGPTLIRSLFVSVGEDAATPQANTEESSSSPGNVQRMQQRVASLCQSPPQTPGTARNRSGLTFVRPVGTPELPAALPAVSEPPSAVDHTDGSFTVLSPVSQDVQPTATEPESDLNVRTQSDGMMQSMENQPNREDRQEGANPTNNQPAAEENVASPILEPPSAINEGPNASNDETGSDSAGVGPEDHVQILNETPPPVPVERGAENVHSVEGARLLAATSAGVALGGGWKRVWLQGDADNSPVELKSDSDVSRLFNGKWQVLVMQTTQPVEGHVHVMGTRRGGGKCRGDVACMYVYDRVLKNEEVHRVSSHLRTKYRIEPGQGIGAAGEKIPKEMLVRRMKDLQAAAPSGPRLDIPKWLDRYIRCFQVVDSIIARQPLPNWFAAEVEPQTGSEPSSPSVASMHEYGSSISPARPIEALFDSSRCGTCATLDQSRSRVEFSGMATVIMTNPVPPEGVHVMEFDVLGRDQCLVGIATPDVDVETYLGNKRGGYGFFAAEGTLKVDGDWKGGHGLRKFKRGDRVGVHVDMTRRTLQFSISKCQPDGQGGPGKWTATMLERVVEGLPSVVHFAVGGAAGGELSIAGGSTCASVGEERISKMDMHVDGGYDNGNWPLELDTQLVEFLNEKASERRKHPRNIRSLSLVGEDAPHIALSEDSNTGQGAGSQQSQGQRVQASSPEPPESNAPSSTAETQASDADESTVRSRSPSLDSEVENSDTVGDMGAYLDFQRRRSKSLGGMRSAAAVRARFVVLKKLESLVAATLPLVDLSASYDPSSAAGRLSSIKGCLFEATKMHLWDAAIRITQDRKEDIPSVTVYRGAAAQHRRRRGGKDAKQTVFGQLFSALEEAPLLRTKSKGKGMMAWQVAFAGEGGDDYGGLFRESIRELAADLQSSATPLFIPVPNGRHNVGFNRDTYIPNPACISPLHLRQYSFIGKLMGCGMRTSNPVGLDLPPFVWRLLLGEEITFTDLANVDERFARAIEVLRNHPSTDTWDLLYQSPIASALGCSHGAWTDDGGLVWTVRSASGKVVELMRGGSKQKLEFADRNKYVQAAIKFRLGEIEKAVDAIRTGLASNVPTLMLPVLTWKELMVRVCGEVTVDLEILKGIIKNKLDGGDADPMMSWIWETLEEFTNEERKQFLGFVWGRERLPRDTSGLQLEVRTQGSHGDEHLPSSHTCFNAIDFPRYSSQKVLRDKLRYAIAHCKAIDTDFAARGPLGEEVDDDFEEPEGETEVGQEVETDHLSDGEAPPDDATCHIM